MRLKLLLDTSYYLIGNILTKSIALISIPMYTTYLTISQYGKVSYLNSMVSIFAIVFSGLIYTSLSRYFYEKDKKIDFKHFFFSYLLVQVSFTVLVMLVFLILGNGIGLRNSTLFIFICALSVFKVINTTYFHVYQPRQLSSRVFFRQIVESVSIFFLSYFSLYNDFFHGEYNVIYSQIIVFFILSLWILVDLFKFFKIDLGYFSWSNVKFTMSYCIKYSSFLWLSTILSTSILQLDKVYIHKFLSDIDLGIYALAFNISFLSKVVSVSLFASFTPRVMRFLANNKEVAALKLLVLLRIIVFQAVFFLMLFSRELVWLIPSGHSYLRSVFIISVISLAFWFDSFSVSSITHLSHLKTTKKVLSPYFISGFIYVSLLWVYDANIEQVAFLFVLTCFISAMLMIAKVGFKKILHPFDLLMFLSLLSTLCFFQEVEFFIKCIFFFLISSFWVFFLSKFKFLAVVFKD